MSTKVCKLCNAEKDISLFNKHNETKDKRDPRCKECMKQVKKNSKVMAKPESITDTNVPQILEKDWQGGKHIGTIFKRKNENTYTVNVNGKYKTFNPDKYNSDAHAFEKATEWKNMMSDKLLLTKNKYKIIHDNKNNPQYLIIQLSNNYVTLCDFDDIEIIRNNLLCSFRGGGEYSKTYSALTNDKRYSFHKFKTGYDMTDHINRYPLDNRTTNFKKTNASENNKNKTKINFRNVTKQSDGTFEATIAYTENGSGLGFHKKYKSITANTRSHANNWIEKECRIIDGIDKLEQIQQDLKAEFELIMNTHAKGFKYQDDNKDLHKEKDTIIKKDKKLVKVSESVINKKEPIFKKFHLINPNYDYKNHLTSGVKIDHVNDRGSEYKFCSRCDKWKLVSEYFNAKQNYDLLDRQCKLCKKSSSSNSCTIWKQNNKEKISEYNKMYKIKNQT